jgi:HEAT repeat protein
MIEQDESPQALLEVLKTSQNEDDVRHAALRLGDEQVSEAVGPLIDLLNNAKTPSLRDAAALALRDLRDQRALDPLAEAVRREPERFATFIYAMQALDCSPVADFLVDLYLKGSDKTRVGLSGCLETLDPVSVPRDVIERLRAKVASATHEAESERDREQLQWLADVLRE